MQKYRASLSVFLPVAYHMHRISHVTASLSCPATSLVVDSALLTIDIDLRIHYKIHRKPQKGTMLNTMWGFASSKEPSGHDPTPSPKKLLQKRLKGKNRTPKKSQTDASSVASEPHSVDSNAPLGFAFSDESLSVSETIHGVEVALDWKVAETPTVEKAVINADLRKANKMHKCQFSMHYPVLPKQAKGSSRKRPQQQQKHRVPLDDPGSTSSLQDAAFLLQSHSVKDELSSVQEELNRLDAEIEAVEEDRTELEHDLLRLPHNHSDTPMWDFDYLLKQHKPSLEDVQELQRRRGRCWTLQLQSMKARDALCATLGQSNTGNTKTKRMNKYKSRVTLTQATTQVSHICLVPGISGQTNYYMYTDDGQSFGHVPPRLMARMKKNALQLDMLSYLSTGPNGAYFASFTSGHVWWGMADPEFEQVVKEWPVYRVAFGEATRVSAHKRLYSWIAVSRDGRVAFKNLPLRLTHLLNSRLADEPAPAEISLGVEGAYFIRFLNGAVDYCFPAHVSDLCKYIQSRGGKITNVLFHPQLSKEFIVRHTELK